MKKISIVFLVLFLVCVGMAIVSCPSDPVPPISDYNMELKGGKYQFNFDNPRIEDGKEYQITFTIENCDENLVGDGKKTRLGGKISYKMDLDDENAGAEKVLSGWAIAVPPTVRKDAVTYIWKFKAGAANADTVDIETPATTPTDGKQFFSLTAQNGTNNYGPNDDFRVKGSFKIEPRATITNWESAGTVTVGLGEGANNTTGKGTLSTEDMEKILALPSRSIIRFTVSVNVKLDGNTRPGYGICGVGGWNDYNSLAINVPAGTDAGDQTFTAEFEIADILMCQAAGAPIRINPYNGAKVESAELFKPGT